MHARAAVCDTAGAAVAGLGTGAAGIAANLIVGAARTGDTGITPGASGVTSANTSVIAAAGVALAAVAVGATLVAGSVAAVLARRATSGRSGTVAEATGISDAAD